MVDGSPQRTADDCAFPLSLLRLPDGTVLPEPLAADIRPLADGKRGGFEKIAASLLGVGIDDLRQREQQRKVRLLSIISAGAISIAIVTIALAISAQLAREESELRQAQAERLIGFMLGDLRTRLKAIGRLEVLDAVGNEAMEYFSTVNGDLSREDALARVKALRQIGEVQFEQGQLESALAGFIQSRNFAERLLLLEPTNNEYLFQLSQAEFWVGYVEWKKSQLAAAEKSMQRYMDHSRTLVSRDPGNVDYRLELAYSLSNLGAIARERSQSEMALAYFKQSISSTRPLLDATPDNTHYRLLLSESWSWVGSTMLDLGRIDEAQVAFETSLAEVKVAWNISRDPSHHEEMADLAIFIADTFMNKGQVEQAMTRYNEALTILSTLVKHDPENANWRWARFNVMRMIAEADRPKLFTSNSTKVLRESIAGLEKLVKQYDRPRLLTFNNGLRC